MPNAIEERRWPRLWEELYRPHGMTSFCYVPLTTARQRLGALGFASKQAAAYDAADVDFLQLVANQVAVAVENALAFDCIAKLKEQLTREKVYLENNEAPEEHVSLLSAQGLRNPLEVLPAGACGHEAGIVPKVLGRLDVVLEDDRAVAQLAGHGGGEGGLAVVDVADGPDVDVKLAHDTNSPAAPSSRTGAWPRRPIAASDL